MPSDSEARKRLLAKVYLKLGHLHLLSEDFVKGVYTGTSPSPTQQFAALSAYHRHFELDTATRKVVGAC